VPRDLTEILALHDSLQRAIPPVGRAPQDLTEEELPEFLLWNAYALMDEIHEAMNEVGWKPWATSRHINTDEFRAELIDAFHFLLNMWMATFSDLATPEYMASVLYAQYKTKNQVNRDRQLKGYDGVTGKCPQCHRDFLTTMRTSVTTSNPSIPLTELDLICACTYHLTDQEKAWLQSRI